uniref:Uncharacterized protein n=1 Tax=Clytia hemisphaerica TaxID=252671 RepID=A0A7M5VHB6_9CNID
GFTAYVQSSSKEKFTKIRKELFELISDDLLPKISLWPEKYRLMFFKRPLGDRDTAAMFWFLLGNGVSPIVTAEWIISSYHTLKDDKRTTNARKNQIQSLFESMEIKKHDRFYYSLFHKR